ncbi:RimJ/RimL family protein N-acetyltransferase [Salirhabdus euzebyi]|uniref:RimJ/RimL family protein N-acetyltransferase n=1 Tax=Salirhabdus euzebyi TaxID=394506 RepID=A0A841Q3U2_9BACI|nr:GNAT family protein [Salirhabdus euzebyi]MBB6453079.1 RimJ/RimL family protein N-acetyltransferase [Salirhabdus euzebyi]
MYSIQGERILLRDIQKGDWPSIHAYASQPIVSQYQAWGPNKEEDSLAFVELAIKDAKKSPRTRYLFVAVEQTYGNVVGAGELNITNLAHMNGEIGYVVHPDFWGKGYGTEVAKLLLHFAFETIKLHRISATCDPRNYASESILKKVGMIYEGRLREDMQIKGGRRDSLLYGMLQREWNKTIHIVDAKGSYL